MKRILLLLLILVAIAISPASALITNNTANQMYYSDGIQLISGSFVHDINYIPIEIEYLFIAIGLIALLISKWEPAEDIFSLISFLALAMSAWFANFMTTEYIEYGIFTHPNETAQTFHVIHTEVIMPNPYLSIFLTICAIFALINILYIFYYKPNAAKLEGEQANRG